MRSQHATWMPVPYGGLHKRQPRRAVICHTNGGGSGSMFGWFSGNARGNHGAENRHVGAHFQVMKDGTVEEYVDTDYVIYHAYSASEFAVGIETEDDGHPETPWTPAQLASIVKLCRELGVPGQLLKDGPSDGVGWHEQYRDWNQTAHACPGKVREQQIRTHIIPALTEKPPPKPEPFAAGTRIAIRLVTRRMTARAIKHQVATATDAGLLAQLIAAANAALHVKEKP
jgi:hypothetical protein